ncbi:hypothetical protein, partial [Streptomyces sp. CC224B]|uniref:hypothetical protein n=1 Tax=Streptomyces sp. CC224B TaxID=3044571 RepID=UPI0024A9C49F
MTSADTLGVLDALSGEITAAARAVPGVADAVAVARKGVRAAARPRPAAAPPPPPPGPARGDRKSGVVGKRGERRGGVGGGRGI